jgi:hypothetical protein
MKYLKKYLMVSSVILHLVILISLFWIIPFYTQAMKAGKTWAESINTSESGVVKDVSEIVRDDLKYRGYCINYNDQNLYVMGSSMDGIEKGDEVNVMVNEHPYSPIKTLMVTITKKTP